MAKNDRIKNLEDKLKKSIDEIENEKQKLESLNTEANQLLADFDKKSKEIRAKRSEILLKIKGLEGKKQAREEDLEEERGTE